MLTSEFRRGLNAFNLTVGAVASAILGAAVFAATHAKLLPLLTTSAFVQSALIAVATFILITAMHVSIHTYFGWRLGRGIRTHELGRHKEAVRLLSVVEGRGMDHYDPAGLAREALKASRSMMIIEQRGEEK